MEYSEMMNEIDTIWKQDQYLSEETEKSFQSAISKLEKAHRSLVNNLHMVTVANSELKKLRIKPEFLSSKEEISERIIDIEKRVIQTIRDATDDLETQLANVKSLSNVEVPVEEEIV